MKTFLLTLALMLTTTVAYAQTNRNYQNRDQGNQKVEIRGGYNGWGYQPGVTYDPRTGWGRINNSVGGFNFRPESGYTTKPIPNASHSRGSYPNNQSPRVDFNYGRPYITQPSSNFRQIPPGGWYRGTGGNW